MKINKLKYMAMSGAATFLTAFALTACDDVNDWNTDSSYDRLFSVPKISINAEDTYAEVTWNTTPGTEYYIIEVSKDSLYDEVPMGTTNGSLVFGQEKDITKSPYTMEGLDGDSKYFFRIKALSTTKPESKWGYVEDYSFKTKAEQIFSPVSDSDRFEDHINLSWKAGAEVTTIIVSSESSADISITLDDAAREASAYTVTGLTASTTYTFTIYNGNTKRGTLIVSTTAAMPSGDYKQQLSDDVTVIDQTTIDRLFAEAQTVAGSAVCSATVGIPAGTTISYVGTNAETGENASISLPDGFSITFFGLSGGEKPILSFPKSLDITGTHAYIRFENVAIADGGCQYLVNQANDSNLDELSFKQCTFSDFERSLIRTQGSGAINISRIVVDDCIFTNMSSGNGYSVIYFGTATTNVGKVELSNSTFNTTQRSFIEASKAPISNGVFIANCTFYNNVASGRYFMDANGQTTNLTIINTIFGKSMEGAKGARTSGTIEFDNCLRASDCVYAGNDFKLDADSRSSADIFTDPDNGDFTLKIKERIGDPRWYPLD